MSIHNYLIFSIMSSWLDYFFVAIIYSWTLNLTEPRDCFNVFYYFRLLCMNWCHRKEVFPASFSIIIKYLPPNSCMTSTWLQSHRDFNWMFTTMNQDQNPQSNVNAYGNIEHVVTESVPPPLQPLHNYTTYELVGTQDTGQPVFMQNNVETANIIVSAMQIHGKISLLLLQYRIYYTKPSVMGLKLKRLVWVLCKVKNI